MSTCVAVDTMVLVISARRKVTSPLAYHIVTSRSEASRQATVEELNGYNLPFDALHFLGEMSQAKAECPHKTLDWYPCYLWQKVDYAKQNGLMHFVDDDPKVLSLFATYAPEIVTTSAEDRVKVQDPLYELAVKVVLDAQRGSVSLVQRHLKLGYNRATRLIDAMSESGIVSPLSEDGLRTIYERYRRTPLYTTIERESILIIYYLINRESLNNATSIWRIIHFNSGWLVGHNAINYYFASCTINRSRLLSGLLAKSNTPCIAPGLPGYLRVAGKREYHK